MTLEDLGRRAVACKHWRWMPGMVTLGLVGEDVPDLSSPATLGCLLALVREAWTQEPNVNHWVSYAVPIFDGLETWRVGCLIDGSKMFALINRATMQLVEAPTEAEALVAALEAAP